MAEAFPIDGAKDAQIGVVVFSESAQLEFALNSYATKQDVCTAIENIPYVGATTNTPEALRITRTECFSEENGDRPAARNVAIIITDGVPYPEDRRNPAIDEAQLLMSSGINSGSKMVYKFWTNIN